MKRLLIFTLLLSSYRLAAQPLTAKYNTDSLLHKLSANAHIKSILHKASSVYKGARIKPADVTLTAFKVAFLEKTFLDEGLLLVRRPQEADTLPYHKRELLSVIDFTRSGNRKRFITVNVTQKKLLRSTLVSHGSATGTGAAEIQQRYGNGEINDKYKPPLFFGNTEDSWRSSPGLMLTLYDTLPANVCHLCRDFVKHPHNCVVVLEGLEEGINDKVRARDIVMHTTGSADYSNKQALSLIAKSYNIPEDSLHYKGNKSCNCLHDDGRASSDYASACGIRENKGYIGRSNGCLVLPEADHQAIMKTVKEGSLVFTYTDAIPATSTDYFATSPIIQQIIAYAEGRHYVPVQSSGGISFELAEQSEFSSFSNKEEEELFGGISAIEPLPLEDGNKGIFLFSDHYRRTEKSYFFELEQGAITHPKLFLDPGNIESVRYQERSGRIFYSFESDDRTGVASIALKGSPEPELLFDEPIPSGNTSDNRGIEGITFDSSNQLWVAYESGGSTACDEGTIPFYCIPPDKASSYRIENKMVYEYPFSRCSCLQTPVFNGRTGNGVSEILAFKNDPSKLLVLERCFDGSKSVVKLYLAKIKPGSTRLEKQLVFDFNDASSFPEKDKGYTPDNLEGMCWVEEKGSLMLYLVSDNNYNKKQRNQLVKLKVKGW